MSTQALNGSVGLGSPHVHLRKTRSTNAVAKELARSGAPAGTIVTADEQTEGRGRQGRKWTAPAGSGLLFSMIVRPFSAIGALTSLAAAVALSDAAELVAGVRCQVKWPNDVWVEGRKVAGILLEARPERGDAATPGDSWLVIGIGVNASLDLTDLPEELRGTAATLGLESPGELLGPLLESLDRWLGATPQELLEAWRDRDGLAGRQVRWSCGSGVACGVDADGNLMVREADGSVARLVAGEVHLNVGL